MSEYAISTLWGSPELDFMYMSASAPEAPPLRDTTIGCFMRLFFWMAACIMRAIWSEAPPAPAATTISTGLFGSQAIAGAAASASDAAIARMPAALFTFLIRTPSLSDVVGCHSSPRFYAEARTGVNPRGLDAGQFRYQVATPPRAPGRGPRGCRRATRGRSRAAPYPAARRPAPAGPRR